MGAAVESYEQACSAHRWDVPARYNIAVDVCDKHPREKLAMVHEAPDGTVRELTWGDMQDMSNRFARRLLDAGLQRNDRVAMLLPQIPEAAAAFLGVWKAGGILLSLSVLYGDEGIRHRVQDSEARFLRPGRSASSSARTRPH